MISLFPRARQSSSLDSGNGGPLGFGTATYVDRGGTFTDIVVLQSDGTVRVRKVPSDRAVVGDLAEGQLTFGTTVATNALLERKGVRTVLVVTRGFADLVAIGDMTRPALFDPDETWPDTLCERVVEVDGRISAGGIEIEPLQLPDFGGLQGAEAVAVVLLNSARNGDHETRVAAAIAARWPDVFVSVGHRISGELGYLARIETTLVDAAITPILSRSLHDDHIPADALAMRSDGSLSPALDLRAPDAVLSGPAGGVIAVAAVAEQGGFERAVGLDMGGTSTDVCRVDRGALPRREGEVRVAGVRLRRPMLEVETIAAGGGSILWRDDQRIGVGPHSAGADPGPQCYGRGGPPTLTDAALACGLVDGDRFDPPLDVSAVALPGPAADFLDIARSDMANAIRRIAVARGIDLADHALVAFGGAAGQHAAHVAARLGISTVLIHPCAGVLCAWGQALARRQETCSRAIWAPLDQAWDAVEEAWSAMDLDDLDETVRSVEVRHAGTDNAIEIVASTRDAARDAFIAEHRRRYGFDRRGVIEVVNARLRTRAEKPDPPIVGGNPWGIVEINGPRLLSSSTTSVHVPKGWTARWIHGLLRLDHVDRRPPVHNALRSPHGLSLWGSRFMSIAEQAGALLGRLARSVNIRERLDYSCAVFDGQGHLVANAPHIPVHLGAMGATVRDLLRHIPEPEPGQAWLTNDPAAGGSHLPDLTVTSAVHWEGRRFFVACRGHHVDVGGLTPGSMPPHSRTLAEEGFAVRHLPLLLKGHLRDLSEHLIDCRELETVRADLEAQIAANSLAARLLSELGPADLTATWMAHLQDAAALSVAARLGDLPTVGPVVRDVIGGVELVLQLRSEGHLVVDLTGTRGPHAGNLNAPPAVVRAAILYALRVLVAADIPLNEGALRDVEIIAPAGSIVDPPAGAAVAGGNVETSQRIVDLVLRGAGFMASSAGTMSNLTIGGDGWSMYETIGAGQGGSPRGRGPSGRQIHMTNTRVTDPEILEARLPLRIRHFGFRRGSGGDGNHPGGDGLIREIEVLRPATAALLGTRRDRGAPGLGGHDGKQARDQIERNGAWEDWDRSATQLQPGDRVRVETPGGGGYS